VFGHDAGHERGDDHMTRAFDAIDRGRRGPGDAGGSDREHEHEKAAEPKSKTPDVDLGM